MQQLIMLAEAAEETTSKSTFQQIIDSIINWSTSTGIKILIALLILFISFTIIKVVFKKLEKRLLKSKKLDKTITKTLLNAAKWALKILIIVCLVGYLGIDTSGITALITSLGVCVGLAVNGALSNIAGGILILVTHPFKDDDYIETSDYSGTVESINLTHTVLRTPDNKLVYIPNGTLSSGSVVNYSRKPTRRVDLKFTISYDADFEKVQDLIIEECNKHPLVLKEPYATVRLSSQLDSAIELTLKVWTKNENYWDVYFDLNENIKKMFDRNDIEIPFNQLDVHIKDNSNQQ